ncbi:C40 family peptidase [Aquimarina sp. ERC-38]|uniref:C40 family peptidase n=1 Tax=Aquimarina sp. ERC-38 TaxID=2949996 RepID=UPI002248269D|nr:C40 family peptidase [Aquimarina sp. ERC-38]UZO81287.1 C40 family peptidase [Aquimarina sp. ERC-38]
MRYLIICLLVLSTFSCGSKKRTVSSRSGKKVKKERVIAAKSETKADAIVRYAKTFKGTKYRYAGTTKKGMDCSGLVYVSFLEKGIELPRTSRSMATRGNKVSLGKVEVGDLIFFKTIKRKNTISHVGIVTNASNPIRFIHASSSKGVIESSLNESYWNKAFAEVRRIL